MTTTIYSGRFFDILTHPWIQQSLMERYNSPNWRWVEVKRFGDEGQSSLTRYYTVNRRTGDLWYHDDPATVCVKFFLIQFLNPVHVSGTMLFNALKIPYDIGRVFFQSIQKFVNDLGDERFFQKWYENIKNSVIDLTTSILSDVWNIVRSPWYGLGIELACLEGYLSDPFRARVKLSEMERNWNHGVSRFHTIQMQCPIVEAQDLSCDMFFQKISKIQTFYLAICMQKQGNLSDVLANGRMRFEILREANSLKEFEVLVRRENREFIKNTLNLQTEQQIDNSIDEALRNSNSRLYVELMRTFRFQDRNQVKAFIHSAKIPIEDFDACINSIYPIGSLCYN